MRWGVTQAGFLPSGFPSGPENAPSVRQLNVDNGNGQSAFQGIWVRLDHEALSNDIPRRGWIRRESPRDRLLRLHVAGTAGDGL